MKTARDRHGFGLAAAMVLAVTKVGLSASIGDVFVIDMENHNLVPPAPSKSIDQIKDNAAAPYLNSLMTPNTVNAAQTSWSSAYHSNNLHPSELNYVWQEGGSAHGITGDSDPYSGSSVSSAVNLSGLLQNVGISWKSYQEDIDLTPGSGTVNNPSLNTLSSTVAPSSQWTVPLKSFSGTSNSYTNAYNSSHQYGFAAKHDGQLFYTSTNGGTTTTSNNNPSNPEVPHYAPLQQLSTDLTNNTVGRYNLITPDLYNDAHSALSGGFTYNGTHFTDDQAALAQGDNFLAHLVPMIMSSTAYKDNGTIIIWWDETEGGDTSAYTLAEIVISPLAKGNATESTVNLTHSSDLKTMQEIFQVSTSVGNGFIGDAGTNGVNDLSSLFQIGTIPTSLPEPGSMTGLVAFGMLALRRRRAVIAGRCRW